MISRQIYRRNDPRSHLQAAQHFRSLSRATDSLVSNPLVSMFTQDVPLGVVPYRSSRASGFRADILGERKDVARAEALLRSVERHGAHETTELVSDAIRAIAQALAWSGLAPYEMWTAGGETDDEDEETVRLSLFTPQRLFHFPRFCIQLVPRSDRKEWGKYFIVLPNKKLWLISMPDELGGYSGYRKLLRRLARFNWTGPQFWQNDLERGSILDTSFNFLDYRREMDVYQCRITRQWGWNGRDTGSEKWTEFALFYRITTFKWAQAVLREHIVSQLNLLLYRLKIEAKIQIVGLLNADELLQLRANILDGTVSYTKAYKEMS